MEQKPLHRRTWRWKAGAAGLLAMLALLYGAWMTGGSFRFPEIGLFPNHLMLARAFAAGRLYIAENPPVDVISTAHGRTVYFGPVPAVLRAPLELVGLDPPTGLVVCLVAAMVVGVFAALVYELAPAEEMRWLRRIFVVAFAANGLTLFMVLVPSVHHESILWAMLFLLGGVWAVMRALRRGVTPRLAWFAGASAALAVGSRFSYVFAAALLAAAVVAVAVRQGTGHVFTRYLVPAVAPLLLMVGGLMVYNAVRFESPFDFGLTRSVSRYQDYMRAGHYWRLDHVPYNLWDYAARLPHAVPHFPYLEAGLTMSEVTRRSATPMPPYHLVHVNELAVSVFVVVPVTALLVFSLGRLRREVEYHRRWPVTLLLGMVALQVGVLSLTMLSTARFMFDFVPLLMLLALVGAVALTERRPLAGRWIVAALGSLTLLLCLMLPASAAAQYGRFLHYQAPLAALSASPP